MKEKYPLGWSVIVLCFNEEKSIASVIEKVDQLLRSRSSENYEIIVVDDGSRDNSNLILQDLQSKNSKIKLITNKKNKGIGESIRVGYFSSVFRFVGMVPGDGQFDLGELREFSSIPDSKFLSFYRADQKQYTRWRKFLTFVNRSFNRVFLGFELRDVNWVKFYHRAMLDQLNLQSKSSLIESEICSKLIYLGHKPIEIPSKYLDRTSGKSRGGSFKTVFRAIKEMFFLWKVCTQFKISHRTRRYFSPIKHAN